MNSKIKRDFSLMCQNTQEKQLKRGEIYFGSQSERSQCMVGLLHCSGINMRQNSVAEGCGRGKLWNSW